MEIENQIEIYQNKESGVSLEVKFEGDTVWLSQNQLSELFKQTKQNISLHINNCFKEGELDSNSVVKDSLTTAADGKKYKIKHYNLDVLEDLHKQKKAEDKSKIFNSMLNIA